MRNNQIRAARLAALCLGSSIFALSPAMASSFSVGGGTVTTTDTDAGADLTGTGGPFLLKPNTNTTGDVITITGVSITNSNNAVTGRAFDAGGINPTTGSYSVTAHGNALNGSDGAGLWLQSSGGTVTFDSTAGPANIVSGMQGIAVINNTNNGSAVIRTGADTVTATTGEVLYGVSQGLGTVSIDSVGAMLTGGGTYGLVAQAGNGAITIGGLNGGIASTINVSNGYGIYASTIGAVNVTLAADGKITSLNGMWLQGDVTTVDSFGTIAATTNAINASFAGPLLVTLEQGSTTSGRILAASSDDTVKLITGANIGGASFDGGGGNNLIILSGSASNSLDVSTAVNFATIEKDDTGTWTLSRSGAAGISGAAVSLNAGTLIANSDALSGNVTSASGSTLQFNQAATGTYTGIISGAAAVTKTGAGILILSNSNTYTGGTNVIAGTLRLGASNALPTSGALNISGGTFDLNGLSQTIGTLSGTGGTIALGAGQLTTNSAATSMLSSSISGGGSLTKSGSGTLTLAATNTYTGGTIISAGTLRIGTGTSGAVAGNIANSASLVFGRSDDITFAGIISGNGAVSQIGPGVLTLLAANPYTGATMVASGRLNVTGAIASSSVSVASGAALSGTGRVGAVSIASGGILSPGTGTPGTLAVAGNLSFASGSIYADNFSPTSAGLTNVIGIASLNGTVTANASAGTYNFGQRYTILTASNGVSGTFASVTTTGLPSTMRGLLSYDANDVFLTLVRNALSPLLSGDATANQRAVAGGIDAALQTGANLPGGFSELFNLSGSALSGALNQLTGEIGLDAALAASQALKPYLDLLTRTDGGKERSGTAASIPVGVRPAQLEAGATRIWGAAYGGHSSFGADPASGAQRLSTSAVGAAVGIETKINDDLLVGGSLAGGNETFSLVAGQSQGISSDIMLGIYAHQALMTRGYLSGALVYGWHNVGMNRTVTISGLDNFKSKFAADDFGGRVEGGYSFGLDDVSALTPFGAIAGESFSTPVYNESVTSGSSGFALSHAARDMGAVSGELGARLEREFTLADDSLSAELHAAWAHQIQNDVTGQASFQNLVGASFVAAGARIPEDSAILGLGLAVRSRSGMTGGARVASQFGTGLTAVSGTVSIGYSW
jgi:autotransporter-associated beta strand protein